MAFVPNVWGITALRIVQGIFVGCISNVAPICTTEFSTEKLRGRLVSLYQVSVVIGIMISYGLNIPFDFVNDGWRYEFAFTGIGPLIMCIGSFIAPESPVWLEKNQRSVIRSQNSEDRDANDSANRIVDTGSKPSDALIEASGQHHYSTFSPTASPAIPYSPNLDNSFSTSQLLDSHRTSESDSPSAESSTISNEAPQSSSTNNSYSTSLHAQKEEIVEQNELPNGENSSPTFNNENNKIEIVASSSGVIIQGNSISFKPISTETAENVANNSDSNKKSEDPMNNAHLAQDNVYSSEISDSSRTCSFLTKLLRNPRSFIVAVVFSMCLQLTGANVIASYTPLILAAAGVETRLQSLLFTLAISAWNSLSVLLSLLFVDSVGRKPLLMMGSGAASVGLLIMVLAFLLQTSSTAHIVMSIVAIVIFLLGFQGGIGPTYYVVVNEIFPASIAGKAVSMSMVINWICNIIIVQLYLPLSQAIGEGLDFM
ncbi:putative Sugar Porter (SP) Family MFS Transporter [Monocercomonoides exilis]|uniref:putative Sugar Porter (SP) Family MFS Transporter n=1 Tax=Monocercomonoides exilis TaxID=2049356 RepID=UPI00355A117B|nr:putative Sugar Porter (SP) Family MFS Transporter [Monocercomonoides exilis]|eukprot:MONOS_4529.1-p1 / transcript=MONOS_4529.1 / gene=MONOS_4529 / organism=Monocercomonoides_exilis_PA203 / gene_product=Sugar Porter (SP) Family MFS Transporter / transcript_product=Sugar Porter (SP) Family MFS Transporter / location=Mono_scaffold00121:79654-81108(+) / protein_length=485 / sequence_SO=supercontig / SO=protein_coding / is_pseudo=false